ncbi:MAG TPA: hypothetical protein VGH23_10450 [Rhizomicrobium sp.]|jgi:hypothetical protein
MPTDADLVNAAYANVIGTIFNQFFQNVAVAEGSDGDTSEAQKQFTAGLHAARESRTLALKIAAS